MDAKLYVAGHRGMVGAALVQRLARAGAAPPAHPHLPGAGPAQPGHRGQFLCRGTAQLVREVTGYEGGIRFDISKPNGAPRKMLNVSRMLALGWQPTIGLRQGLAAVYEQEFGAPCAVPAA